MTDWDPIGVRGVPEAQDEYDSYVLELYAMLVRGKPHEDLVVYLNRAQKEKMGLPIWDSARAERVAVKLFGLVEQLDGQAT